MPISVDEINFLTSIKVYPNPVSDYCKVEVNDIINVEVFVTNMLGQRVVTPIADINTNFLQLKMENLPSGIYLVSIKKNDILTTRKIIKE